MQEDREIEKIRSYDKIGTREGKGNEEPHAEKKKLRPSAQKRNPKSSGETISCR